MDEYLTRPVGIRLDRLRSTPGEITVLDALSPRQWQRGGIHQARGRMAIGEWVASLAGHDDNHLAQLGRTLDGRP